MANRQRSPRTETVEQHAQRNLERREDEEVRAGEQAQVGGRQREIGCEVARDDRVDVAQQDGKEEAAREWNENDRDQLRWKRFAGSHRIAGHASILMVEAPAAFAARAGAVDSPTVEHDHSVGDAES